MEVIGRTLLLLSLLCVACADSWLGLEPTFHTHFKKGGGPYSLEELVGHHQLRAASLKYLYPSQLLPLYNLTYNATAGAGKTIAIIDAYGASTAESDLAFYTNALGLPACTTANGCFKKVDQTGGTNYPPDSNVGNWGLEVALDVQAAHVFAPGAKKLLVVANSNGGDLYTAIQYASAHADYVTMSFGANEGAYVTSYDTAYFSSSTVSYFASTGDTGGAIEFPATSPHVIAVGGTSLYTNADYSFSSEQGWASSGGGCSAYFPVPALQNANPGYASLGCVGKRAVPDVAMLADPNSGLVIYFTGDPTLCTAPNCYFLGGGTSLSSPLFAARAARRGTACKAADVYGTPAHIKFRDITVGNNGHPCKVGLDLCTGLGSYIGNQ